MKIRKTMKAMKLINFRYNIFKKLITNTCKNMGDQSATLLLTVFLKRDQPRFHQQYVISIRQLIITSLNLTGILQGVN